MPAALTTQEKKVLGFIILMVGLGLVMLALQSTGWGSKRPSPAASTTPKP